MRTKSSKKNKINVVTLGCSKNVYDSEVLMGQLKANNKSVSVVTGSNIKDEILKVKSKRMGILRAGIRNLNKSLESS